MTCRGTMAQLGRCRAVSIAGVPQGSGTGSCRRCRQRPTRGARWTGICTSWMRPLSGRISTPPAPAETALSGGVAQAREALGRSQGGFSTKLHLRAEGNGRPITAVLTGGERHEQIALEALLDGGAIRRPGRGRPRLRPRRVAGDKGYSSPTARDRLRGRHIRPVIPSKSNQRRQCCATGGTVRNPNGMTATKKMGSARCAIGWLRKGWVRRSCDPRRCGPALGRLSIRCPRKRLQSLSSSRHATGQSCCGPAARACCR